MKVLLANPPWLRPGWYGVRAGSRWPHMERGEASYMPFPFLMAYAAAVLEQDGVEVEVIDACAERIGREEFLARFEAVSPDLVVMETSTPSLHGDMRTVGGIRELGFDGPLLLAGLHKALYDPGFLEQHAGVDGTLVGEYELTLRELLRRGGVVEEPLAGLIWRGSSGLLDGGRKESQQDLDDFPWPARHLFPMDCYHDLPGGIPGPSVQMWGSRGCSFTCNFCAWPQILYGDNLYRTRTGPEVADEVAALLEQGYESVYFDDDTFNLGKRRTAELGQAFIDRGIDSPWAFMGRADTCDPAQYEDLVKSGLAAVKYGVESADSSRLRQIGKNLEVERVRESVRVVKSLGIKVHLTFMFGLQGENLDSMQRTLDLAYELDPDSAQFTIAVPFPGSRLHDELGELGRLEGLEYEDLDGYRTGVVSTDALEAEQIISFVHGVHRRWEKRARPAGPAPRIPVSEVGGSAVSVGLLARAGQSEWLGEVLAAVAGQEGPSREVVVVAESSDPQLEEVAARTCDWATFLDAEPGSSVRDMCSSVLSSCTGRWIALFQEGAVPRPGWLLHTLAAAKEHRDAGALALPLWRGGENGAVGALSMSRWGRVLVDRGGAQRQDVFAVSSRAGIFGRALLEDVDGFDAELPAELGDSDLALRGLLMGYRSVAIGGPGVEIASELAFRLEDEAEPQAEAVRAWARGRLRLALKSIPRETWRQAWPAIALELAADVYRAAREQRHAPAVLRGFVDGLRAPARDLSDRKQALGRRRVGDAFVRKAFEVSEEDMAHCTWQRVLRGMVS